MTQLSILLPVRDGATTVAAALRSVQEQAGVDFECVIVDDGSLDDTVSTIRATIAGDHRFRLIEQRREGLVTALCRAVGESEGELLGRQDADDESLPGRFRKQIDWLRQHPDTGLVATGVEIVSPLPMTDGARRYHRWLEQSTSADEVANALWTESPLPHPTVIFRREVYERVGGYRDRGWPEDYDLWLRMRRHEVVMEKIPQRLYRWTDHPARASRTQAMYSQESFLRCRVHHLARFLGLRSVWIWGAGRDGKKFARSLLAEGTAIEGFLDVDPRKIGRTAQGRPVLEAEAWLQERDRTQDCPPGNQSPADQPDAARPDDTCLPRLAAGPVLLVAVGAAGAREKIQARLRVSGFREGTDFLCVA